VLEEPTRVIETSFDEAESYIKRLSDDFSQAVNQLSGWQLDLRASVEKAAFSEAWEKNGGGNAESRKQLGELSSGSEPGTQPWVPSDYNKPPLDAPSPSTSVPLTDRDDLAAARRRMVAQQRKAVADAIAVAEAATQQARVATLSFLTQGALGAGGGSAEGGEQKATAMARAVVGLQAPNVKALSTPTSMFLGSNRFTVPQTSNLEPQTSNPKNLA
jgi:hypothetical protein